MPTLTLTIENAYAHEVITTTETVDVPAPGNDLREWADEYLFPFTGTGRPDDAIYTVTIAGSDDPALQGMTFEFG